MSNETIPVMDDAVLRERENDGLVRGKWILDGATTLAEAAQLARDYAASLQDLHDKGYVLREPVEDDYGSFYKP